MVVRVGRCTVQGGRREVWRECREAKRLWDGDGASDELLGGGVVSGGGTWSDTIAWV
jgi:hypothetical protein